MILAYDSDCGFCSVTANWLASQAFVIGEGLELVPYDAPDLADRMPGVDESHADGGVQLLLPDGRLYRDAVAVGEIFKRTSRWWWVGQFMCLPLISWFAQIGYWIVARNRRRISRWLGWNACQLPGRPEQ